MEKAEKETGVRDGASAPCPDDFRIDRLGLPPDIVDFYHASGIRSLYPPQAQAVQAGLLDGRNILAAIPTASGKTLLAELAAIRSIRKGGKVLYVVPLRALASEKYRRFREFEAVGISAGLSTGDLDRKEEFLGAYDIIVATSEKVDSFLRNETAWLQSITVIILDEVHLIDSARRGPTLEVTIIKMRRLNPDMQIVALSATIGNAEELARWLNASPVRSDWRPTRLREGVFCNGTLFFEKERANALPASAPAGSLSGRPGKRASSSAQEISAGLAGQDRKEIVLLGKDRDPAVSLAADVIRAGGQCLIFENSRRNAVSAAKKAAAVVPALLSADEKKALAAIAEDAAGQSETEMSAVLASCIRAGTAFHHAGLSAVQREIIETHFLNGSLKVISSTPTLAAGLNLPARRVVIRSFKRYDVNDGMTPIPVLEYKQMAGRAGRPHLDPYGEAVLLASEEAEIPVLYDQYIHAVPEDVMSRLGTENMLRTHVLSTIVNGFADTRSSILSFFKSTFFAMQEGQTSTIALNILIGRCLAFLTEKEMIHEKRRPASDSSAPAKPGGANNPFVPADRLDRLSGSSLNSPPDFVSGGGLSDSDLSDSDLSGERFAATGVGALVSRLYIDPLSASRMLDGLLQADRSGRKLPAVGLLQLICSTPDMNLLYMKKNDYEPIDEFVILNPDSFLRVPDRHKTAEYEWFLCEVKTALMLYDWTQEVSENEITKRYDIGEGDIRTLSETAEWICGAAARLSGMCGSLHKAALSDLALCLRYGASAELLSLLKIPGIGRVRARRLYNAGFRTRGDLMTADAAVLAGILGPRTAGKVFAEIGRPADPFPEYEGDRPSRRGGPSGREASGRRQNGSARPPETEVNEDGRKAAVQKNFGDFF